MDDPFCNLHVQQRIAKIETWSGSALAELYVAKAGTLTCNSNATVQCNSAASVISFEVAKRSSSLRQPACLLAGILMTQALHSY